MLLNIASRWRQSCNISLARLVLIYLFILTVIIAIWAAFSTDTGYSVLTGVRNVFSTPKPEPPPAPKKPERVPSPLRLPVGNATHSTNFIHNSNEAIHVHIPSKTKIVALVFYGRRDYIKILDCYLKRNLKYNGGLLDEVIFAVNTDNKDDLRYLDELVETSPSYTKHVRSGKHEPYVDNYESVTGPDNIYIKIDDDVVFIEDNTIPALAKRLLEEPQYFAVSANVINNPAMCWVHYGMGLYEPYWPEMDKPKPAPEPSWRASELPSYEGPLPGPKNFKKDGSTAAPYKNHRWLPVRVPETERYDMALSPASTLQYAAFGPSLENWATGAQTHYSFLQHLEEGTTWRYKYDIWDYHYNRLSINFLALWGSDIMDAFPFPQWDDEDYLTIKRPRELKRRVVMDGGGVAVHFAFGPQYRAHEGHGLTWTDVLDRYRLYAEEMVCPFPNRTSKAVVPS